MPFNIIYEGDSISLICIQLSGAQPDNLWVRFYRTLSGLDTGEKISAKFDTEWHFLGQVPISTLVETETAFIDGGAATSDPLDLYLANGFYGPLANMAHFGLSESGWFVAALADGRVQVSERYLVHAWPVENTYSLGENITDLAIHYDNVYVGTQSTPFIMALAPGEQAGLQSAPVRFPEPYPCLPGTMAATASGAAYTSPEGVIGLSRDGQRVLTHGVANSGDTLYSEIALSAEGTEYRLNYQFKDTQFSFVYLGEYYGLMGSGFSEAGNPIQKTMFVFDLKDQVNGPNEFSQLVTLDFPASQALSWTAGPQGIHVLVKESDSEDRYAYVLPLPDNRSNVPYNLADKYCYIWRSKIYHFPGETSMGAARVDMKGKPIRFRLISGCNVLYETVVCNSRPFTFPNQILASEFCIELEGTAEVSEVCIAGTMRELLEQ